MLNYKTLSNADIDVLRAQTPGCARVLHLNQSGAGLMSLNTLTAMQSYMQHEAAIGSVEARLQHAALFDQLRQNLGALIHANTKDINFFPSGTLAWLQAFSALPAWRAGDRILLSRQEWGSNVAAIQRKAEQCGARVEVMPCTASGEIDVAQLASMLDERVKLLTVTWLPANGGLINDAVGVGQLAKAHGIPYFVDAGQALGQLPINLQELHCDVLKAAGRKHLRGPKGTAICYIHPAFAQRYRPQWQDASHWMAATSNFELSELSNIALAGLHDAVLAALDLGIAAIWQRTQQLAQDLRARLRALPEVQLLDLGSRQSGIVSFLHSRHEPFALQQKLHAQAINIGANGVPYTPLDLNARGLTAVARASVSYLNTEAELAQFCQVLRHI